MCAVGVVVEVKGRRRFRLFGGKGFGLHLENWR
jgi:hypothetical protein